MKVLELKDYNSLRAFYAFHKLMLGLKMLPAYMGIAYEEFYQSFAALEPSEQAKMIREAAFFVELTKEEILALICFVTDANGIPYGPSNLKNLGPAELIDIICAVCEEIGKIKVDLVTEAEKKN
jgi:hypothetical protein